MTFTTVHGMSGVTAGRNGRNRKPRHTLYTRWANIKSRCTNVNHPRYPDYGGRGIFLCERWHIFVAFLADVGEPPGGDYENYSLDRIDNDGPYAPWNVQWATRVEQRANRRDSAQDRREQYTRPWPFGVLQVDKAAESGGMDGYVDEALSAYARGDYEFTQQEEAWLDAHYAGWREVRT